jgi:hypothetical protein
LETDNIHHGLFLSSLAEGMPGLTPAYGAVLAEAASVCLEEQGHGLSTGLRVEGDFLAAFPLHRLTADEQMRRSHNDAEKATENGACGIAILAVRDLTGLGVLLQSRRGMGFDYWLSPQEDFLFQSALRLEVSGIRRGKEGSIRERVRRKMKQTERSGDLAPALIAVVEFSGPRLRLIQR